MTKRSLQLTAPIKIQAAEGENGGPPTFEVVAYTGAALQLGGWDRPVVVDLDGMSFGNSLVANLDHDRTKRVGHVTAKQIQNGQLTLAGAASAATEARREVIESAADGFVWQASIEANPGKVIAVGKDKTITANGQTHTGPLYHVTQSTLKGFAFVSHGADDNTAVSIAAESDDSNPKGRAMDPKVKAWCEKMGLDVESLSDDQIKNITADYAGREGQRPPADPPRPEGWNELKAETKRRHEINAYALKICDGRHPNEIDAIERLAASAIESGQSLTDFKLGILEASTPAARLPINGGNRANGLTNRILEAAICQAGRLEDAEKHFTDQEMQAAHDRFGGRISLNQVLMIGAEANGYRSDYASKVTIEANNAAFGLTAPNRIQASGFSNVNIPTMLSNIANKFLRRGWDSVDMTPLRIAAIRNVSDFKTITTTSLVGDLTFEKVGKDGQIKHGDLGEVTYTNKADTYARMLAITRQDIINDDLGALTDTPRRLGRGAGLKLNDIFWTEFLNNSTFFASGNSNVSTVDGQLGDNGLSEAEVIFMDQTDPDSNPLNIMPEILLVPTALKHTAQKLMDSDRNKGDTDGPDANIWRGRFRVESSPYMSNASYTGYSAVAWYLLANPNTMPVIEIAALNGRVEPVVESTDAAFNVLGAEQRGYSDVGVSKQEYRGGVRADGSAP